MNQFSKFGIAAIAFVAGMSNADVTVNVSPFGAGYGIATQMPGGEWRVEVFTNWASTTVDVSVRGLATDRVGNVTVQNDGAQPARLSIRGSASSTTPLTSVESIKSTGTKEVWITELLVSGNVGTGSGDAIDVTLISASTPIISVNGSILGNIIVSRSSTEGYIANMTVGGDVLGNITANNSSIRSLTVAGSIGNALNPSTITVSKNIDSLIAGSIYADVDANIDVATGIATFRTTSGNFVGSLTGRVLSKYHSSVTQRFWIAGDLDADILISDKVNTHTLNTNPEIQIDGEFVSGRKFVIGNTLSSGTTFKFDSASGLKGQVIINGSNGAGTWSGSVVVGSTTLSPTPNYSAASSSLGGGAIGHVPYQLYGNDCSPVFADPPAANQFLQTEIDGSNDTDTDGGGPDIDSWDAKAVTLRFYGPVKTGVNVDHTSVTYTDMPVIISYIEPISGNPIDVTHRWKVEMNDSNTSNRPAREIKIRGHKWSGGASDPGMYVHAGTYRVTPRLTGSARLYCDGLNVATPPSVADFEYEFTVGFDCDRDGVLDTSPSSTCWRAGGGCVADYDFSGFVDTEDYDLFVHDFEQGYPWTDVDSSGFVDTVDFDAFVEAYEVGC
ncbi:MAG TPA: hypothetical protein VK176_06505 [Phycisphaerales bacterium]|nr:hypothetical protein [Phycisphaerales bacterium]